jgi:hypothetical protein
VRQELEDKISKASEKSRQMFRAGMNKIMEELRE